jgi:uncharacterized protein (DUF433 family)
VLHWLLAGGLDIRQRVFQFRPLAERRYVGSSAHCPGCSVTIGHIASGESSRFNRRRFPCITALFGFGLHDYAALWQNDLAVRRDTMETDMRSDKTTVDWRTIIHSDPAILVGKPVVKGTRLSVDFILRLFGKGWTAQDVLDNYPGLTPESLQAVFAYSGECMSEEALYDLPAEAHA